MLAETTARLAFPLAALEAAGPLRSKAQLHMLAYVAQREFGDRMREGRSRQEAWYGFGEGRCVPHSPLLDMDVSESPSLVVHTLASPFASEGFVYHSYKITDRGRERLDLMRAGAAPGVIGEMECRIKDLCAGMPAALMEAACGAFCVGSDRALAVGQVREDVASAMRPILRVFEDSDSWRAGLLWEILDAAEVALGEAAAKGADAPFMRVVLCVSKEIASRCRAAAAAESPPDPDLPDPLLADAGDLAENLMQYCHKRGVINDPIAGTPKGVLSDEDVRSICVELGKMNGLP